ncbi:MAG: NUDIX hydrolase [Clostridiales bacterium]|nr:NUDIX hydrolase [Clostridiales bacterium]
MRDPNLEWEELHTEHIIQDRWIDFRKTAYRYPDGRVFEPFYTFSRPDYAVIVASDTEGRFICVRQFRQGIREVTTEFPAGGLDSRDGSRGGPEEALAAAKRELKEETGYVSDCWTRLMTIPSNATISDNYAHIFRAENCRPESEQHLDETEVLRVVLLDRNEMENLIAEGEFQQSVHVLAWLLALRAGRI